MDYIFLFVSQLMANARLSTEQSNCSHISKVSTEVRYECSTYKIFLMFVFVYVCFCVCMYVCVCLCVCA